MSGRRTLAFLVLLSIMVLLNLPVSVSTWIKAAARENFAPFQNAIWFLMTRVKETASLALAANRAINERGAMLQEIAGLREEVRRLKRLGEDNEELRKQLGFKIRHKHKLTLCEVMAHGDASGWWQTLRVNKGIADGIGPDMPVITTEGLIGRTQREISAHTCDILFITDPACRAAAKLSRTGALGIVRGSHPRLKQGGAPGMFGIRRLCRMDYLPKDRVVYEGDEVVTSGLGGVYPEGLLIGHVSRVFVDPSGLYQSAEIAPTADMGLVKYAFVVVK